jgi:HEAT repeats
MPSSLEHAPRSGVRPDSPTASGPAGVDLFVTSVARAIQRHQAYPPDSPLCAEAVTSCLRAVAALADREAITLRAQSGRLLADDDQVQTSPLVAAELSRRFRRAGIAAVTFEREVSARELARFCRELVRRDDQQAVHDSLPDVLLQYGVERVHVTVTPRAEVLELGVPDPARLPLVAHQRARQADAITSGATVHLYPPDKGWVRVDPAAALRETSLLDMVLLVEDPAALAVMLVQLSEDESSGDPADALADKVEEISGLIARLEPTLVEQLFARLARSVLALDAGRRQQLLRDTVLPGLLEGRADGALLRHFPDLALADSLSLLLDLQVAAPEMLRTAFERLDLSAERQSRLKPIIDERIAARTPGAQPSDDLRPGEIDGLADGGIRVTTEAGKDFSTFATFDVSLDATTRTALASIVSEVDATDMTLTRLTCVRDVLTVEPNPEVASGLVTRAGSLLAEIVGRKDWPVSTALVASFRELAEAGQEERPEVADQVRAMLAGLASTDLCLELARLAEASPERGDQARAMFAALGALAGPAVVDALGRADDRARRALVKLAATSAAALAPALVPSLSSADAGVVRHTLQIVGHAGPGVEAALAPLVSHADEWVAREACRALARIGTPEALAAVSAALARGGRHHALAEEALWRFPAALAREETRRLLSDREFVRRQPDVARALLSRFAEGDARQAAALAKPLVSLRFHVWRPALMRLGRMAATVARRL